MASRSLQSDPINSISDILRDGYRSGFPILKELIQNADDAKARRLVFGMHSGFQGQSKHPLLQCPGLWVFNDGEFTKENDEAICSFGQSSKAGESGAIGKFGLGMKSVFHLCEAFFYVAFDGHQPFEVLLNPWKGRQADDSFHNSWNDDCPQDYDALRTIVVEHKLVKGCHSWFLLWIPLRRSEHVPQRDGKPYGGIVDKYPGDIGCNDLLSDNRLSSRIRSIVPLLKNLESIELASSDQIPVFKVQMTLDKGAQRVDHTSDALVSTGNVTDGTTAKRKLRFYIQQRALLGLPPFSQFKNLNVWPKRQEYGKAKQDKSEAVGAILVSGASADGEEAKAFIDWAVFLPMDESMGYEAQLQKSMQQYRIVLHGQFFVDAGRRSIASFNHLAEPLVAPSPDLDDVDLHKGWNQAIAQQVILPQLLPTLAKFAESLNDSEKEELTRAIFSARSKGGNGVGKGFWELFQDFICKDQAWVRLITPGGLKWSHEKMTSTTRLLKLPPPPMHDIDRTWKVLPNLEKLTTGGTLLIDEQAPSLMRTHHDWDTSTLIDVLDGVDRDEVCLESGMSYLISFLCLEKRRYVNSSEVQRKLISIVRSMLQRESLQTFRSIRATFLKLVSLIKPEFRFAVGPRNVNAVHALNDITLKLLMGAEVAKLVLPGDLDPDKEDASIGSPNEGEVRNLLVVIDREISRLDATVGTSSFNQVENFLYASQSILQKLNDKKDERGIAIRTNRSLRVLLATSAHLEKICAVTFDELHKAHQSRLLFIQDFGHGKSAYPVAAELAKLLPEEKIWVVEADIAGFVQRNEQNSPNVPSAKDTKAAYDAVGKAGMSPVLADLNCRRRFIQQHRLADIKGHDVIRGMRYVLHGSVTHHDDDDATLWVNTDQADEVWVKLKRMVEPDTWNVIDSSLAGLLIPDDREKLGIRRVCADDIIEHMGICSSLNQFDPLQFNDTEIATILKQIRNENLWKSIPLHRTHSDTLVQVNNNSYLDPDNLAASQFLNGINLIQISNNSDIQEKQNEWIPRWTQNTTIERALAQAKPGQHWKAILASLDQATTEKIPQFRTVAWLPLVSGGYISPEDVIDLEPLASDIDRLASQHDYCYAGIAAIAKEVQQHENFSKLKLCFASGLAGLERLGLLIACSDDYSIGDSSLGDNLESLIDYLSELKSQPAWSIVKNSINAVGIENIIDVQNYIIKAIQKRLASAKLVEILNEISAHRKPNQSDIFNHYLKQLSQYPADLPHALEKIKLLARDGHWESANKLCVGVQGIVKGSVLCQEQAHILQNHLHGLKQNTNNPDSQRDMVAEDCISSIDLEDYFKPWRDLLPSGPIGAFFALMGTSLRNLADEWLKPHSFKYFIDQLNWNDPRSRSSPVWDYQGREPTKQESLDKLEFIPIISNVKEMVVVSLLGEDIHVLVDNEFDSLVLGNLTWAGSRNGKSFFRLPLRELPKQNKYAKTALSNILKKTCECILLEAYRQPAPNLGSLWSSLVESHQLQLQVAHDLILDNLPHDLSNLRSAKNNPKIKKQLEHFKKLKTSRSENKFSNKSIDQIDKDINQAKQDLSHIMTTDPGVQKSVLDGIRVRIKENQYEVSSIAFELLQNADDAVVELQKLMLSDAAVVHPNSHVGRFVMETNGDTVRFLHWGRPINYMGHGTASNSSYGEDLQRMLILAASDKDENTGLTGKFGLGFKSVLLATDAPCILSDDLEVEIVGGCLPVLWSNCDGAKKSLHQHELPDAMGLRGTVVEFVLNAPEKRSQVLDRFEALAGLQCVFSKVIRSIQVNDVRHDWQPDTLFNDLQSIEIGSVRLPDKGGLKKSNLLNFRLADGCFALRLGTRGFVRFQENVTHFPPCVWVTAPTREPAAIGLVLNSHFELDTGRGGLTHGESARANLKKARQFGEHASKLVISATRLSQGCWELMKQRLKLTHEITVPEFWTTFWEQIPTKVADEEDGESARLLSEFGCGLYEGYLSLSGEIPNGLTGILAAFIHPAAVCLSINSRWEKLCDILTNWSNLIAKFPVSGWVSSSVAHQLKTFNPDLKELSVKFLLDFVTEGSRHCGTELSNTLGELLAQVSPEENKCVQEAMKRLLFQAKDDSWRVGYELLKEGDKCDEPLLPFAPSSHILHEAYMGQGFAWIQRYANCCLFPADLIAGWILAAPKDAISARVAGLQYLLGNQEVQACIRRRLPGSWIESLEHSSPYLKDFTVQEKNQLLGMFSSIPTWKEDIIETPQQSNELKGNDALMAIRDWWYKNRVEQLKKFDDAFWPSNVQRKFDHPSESRESWMTLFAIGLMQRIGRSHDFQNRGFIDSMQSAGFWDVFCNKDPKLDGQAWLTILKEYGENQKEDETYSMWMDSFPRLYRLARWFTVYQHVFQTIDFRSQSEMDSILISKFDPVMCGSGIEAPTLQSSLKLGKHIIIRELLRFGILKSDTAKSWAFKPGRGIKQLFEKIGFEKLTGDDLTSVQIYDALCKSLGDDAIFQGYYDIPLIILNQNDDVLNRILTQ